jgi:hypothetical protein
MCYKAQMTIPTTGIWIFLKTVSNNWGSPTTQSSQQWTLTRTDMQCENKSRWQQECTVLHLNKPLSPSHQGLHNNE